MSQDQPLAPKPHPDLYLKHILIGCGLVVLPMGGFFAGAMAPLYKSATKLTPVADLILADVRDGNLDRLYEESSTA